MILKTVLAQIYCDDSKDISERTIIIKIKKAKAELESMTIKEDLALDVLGSNTFAYEAQIKEIAKTLEIDAFCPEYSVEIHHALEEKMQKAFGDQLKIEEHNAWFDALNQMGVTVSNLRKVKFLEHFIEKIGES